jgi:hypothetical protein
VVVASSAAAWSPRSVANPGEAPVNPSAIEVSHSSGLFGELVDPDIDVVDHDRSLARILGVIDTEEVEAGHRSAIDRQPSSRSMGDRHGLPRVWLLTQRLEDRSKIDKLDLDSQFR